MLSIQGLIHPLQADHLRELEQAHRLVEAEATGLRAEASKLNKQLQVWWPLKLHNIWQNSKYEVCP
jgi:hypothetical protein